jgi:hypothetical protein
MMLRTVFSGLFCLLLFPLLAQPAAPPVSELYQLQVEFAADYGSLRRYYVVDESPARLARFREFYRSYLDRLATHDFSTLSQAGRVEYLLLRDRWQGELAELTDAAAEQAQVADWTDIGDVLYRQEALRSRGQYQPADEVAEAWHQIYLDLTAKAEALRGSDDRRERHLVRRAVRVMNGKREALERVYTFYVDYDPEFRWWTERPFVRLNEALESYVDVLGVLVDSTALPPDDGSGIIGNPIGRAELIRQLELEGIPYTPEELVDIAQKEFAWCDAELLKASRAMGFGDDWRAAQEKVKQAYVPPGRQPEAMVVLYDQSIAFLKENDLLTIPPLAEETWRVSMIPPERQRISPFFLGGEVLQISYPTGEMEHEEKLMSMRGNNPHFSRSTVHHELIAGHHLQQFMNRRYRSYRNFRTPFWTEGWALYWELLLWDLDFPRSPEDRIGMLFWRMHRCARIIFSLNYHLEEWTPQQCIDFLVERVGHERANAEGEVRRSFTANYGPLYQLAYMVGGLQFWALKQELVDSGQMSYRQFHDAVLRENAMPVIMVRALLTDLPLTEAGVPEWRFYRLE